MARSFDGSSTDKIVGASVTPINFNYNNPFSVAGWFNFTTFSGDIAFFGHTDPSANFKGWELLNQNGLDGYWRFFLVSAYPAHAILVRSTAITAMSILTWYHLCATYDGSQVASGVSMYRNGSPVAGDILVDNLGANATTNTIPPYFGRRANGTVPFTGKMSDISVWNVVLTGNEVASLARGRRPNMVRSGALVAYWPLDGLASPEPDLSGVANNGTLTGTAYAPGPPVTMFTPRWPINDVFPYTAPSFIPAWAAQSNLPVIGAGTY